MGRTLTILAIVSAVYAALSAALLSGEVLLLLPLAIVVAAAVFAFLQRDRIGLITGLVLVGFTIFAAIAVVGGVSGEDAGTTGFSTATGHAASITAGLLVVAAVVAIAWPVGENWSNYTGAALVALGIVLAWVLANDLGSVTGPAIAVAVVVLLSAFAPVQLLRQG